MSGKTMVILAVVAVVFGALAVWTSRDESGFDNTSAGENLLPGIDINSIDRIEIESAGEIVTVTRSDSGWVIPSRFNYPANFKKVRDLLLKLEEITIGQVISVNETQKEEMKLLPALATRLRLLAGDDTLVELLLGDTRQRKVTTTQLTAYGGVPGGRFVSVDAGETVCLTADALREVTPQPKQWLEEQILNVPESDVTSIEMLDSSGTSVKLSRGEDGSLTLPDLAEDEEFDTSKSYSVKSALGYLRFNDIADPALADTDLGLTQPGIFEATTSKGHVYTVKIGASPTNSADRYVRLSVAYNPPASDDEEGDDDKAEEKIAKRAAAEKEAMDLNEKLAKWTYVIPSYKVEAMQKKREDLLKKKEEENESETDADNSDKK